LKDTNGYGLEKLLKEAKFPVWAPEPIIAEWQEKIQEAYSWLEQFPELEPDTHDADIYHRLLSYEDMKYVWEKLPKYKISPELFSSMVGLSSIYPKGTPTSMAPKEYEQWLKDVRETSLKLAQLIQLSGFDQLLQTEYYHKRNSLWLRHAVVEAFKCVDDEQDNTSSKDAEYERWPDLTPKLLSSYLITIVNMKSENEAELFSSHSESVRLDKPNHPNAGRSYFIKQLTHLLREKTGKPLRKIVTITTAAVFDNPGITERQIIRIAP